MCSLGWSQLSFQGVNDCTNFSTYVLFLFQNSIQNTYCIYYTCTHHTRVHTHTHIFTVSLHFFQRNPNPKLYLSSSPYPLFLYLYLFHLLFSIGVELINNIVLGSGVQQSDSVIHARVHSFSNSLPI